MQLRRKNKLFPSLNTIIGKTASYGSKGVLRQYNYRSDPNLCLSIVALGRTPCVCRACITKLSLLCDYKTKYMGL